MTTKRYPIDLETRPAGDMGMDSPAIVLLNPPGWRPLEALHAMIGTRDDMQEMRKDAAKFIDYARSRVLVLTGLGIWTGFTYGMAYKDLLTFDRVKVISGLLTLLLAGGQTFMTAIAYRRAFHPRPPRSKEESCPSELSAGSAVKPPS